MAHFPVIDPAPVLRPYRLEGAMSSTVLNILLGVVGAGFVLCVWVGSLPSGPEGPVGAWLVPVPFLLLLTIVMGACIAGGRFAWLPGGRFAAVLLLAGFLVALGAALIAAFDSPHSALDVLLRLVPFAALGGCLWLVGNAPWGRILGPAILCATSLGGWALMGYGAVSNMRDSMAAAQRDYERDRADAEARDAQSLKEFRALPADAPLIEVIHFTFVGNETVQREVRERIANWPGRDEELAKILSHDATYFPELTWTISYIAHVHPAPPASLAPAYARALDRGYRYWESTMKYDEYAAKSEPEVSTLILGAERIQQAGGDLRPQLSRWYELLHNARGMGGLAHQVQMLLKAHA